MVFELSHPSKAPAGATKTARFAIALVSGSPPAGMVDALAAHIRAHETAFVWKILETPRQGLSASSIGESAPVLLAAAGILGLAVLGWALWRRRLARRARLK